MGNFYTVDTSGNETIAGNLTVNTSDLKVSTSTHRVGVGTASPTDVLDIFSSTVRQFLVTTTGSAVNYLSVTGSATTNPLQLTANGTDTNISLQLVPQGTGSIVIGSSSPNGSALLEVDSTTQGFLAPRMTTTQRNAISSPATGLMIYNTTTNEYESFNGSSWVAMSGGGGGGANSPSWTKYTVSFTALATASTTNSITLFSLPAQNVISRVVIKHSTAFSGGGITAYTVAVGLSGAVDKYASEFDVFQTVASNVAQISSGGFVEDFSSSTTVLITAVSTGANLNAATQGSVDIWVETSALP